ncbi:receptor-like kinase 1 [Artemisia annua]|uniref:Receptor-like kinase 1 n=1 Tax=Artemisia annua TaxID=35608 RepID=A0A2U1KK19_ARTAN|nr:receptor-like kinase 1 [Artemisia annua]
MDVDSKEVIVDKTMEFRESDSLDGFSNWNMNGKKCSFDLRVRWIGADKHLEKEKNVYNCVLKSNAVVVLKKLVKVTLTVPEPRQKIVRVGAMDLPDLAPIRAYHYDQEEKLILYDYIPTGSLYDRLCSKGVDKPLKFESQIAMSISPT